MVDALKFDIGDARVESLDVKHTALNDCVEHKCGAEAAIFPIRVVRDASSGTQGLF